MGDDYPMLSIQNARSRFDGGDIHFVNNYTEYLIYKQRHCYGDDTKPIPIIANNQHLSIVNFNAVYEKIISDILLSNDL